MVRFWDENISCLYSLVSDFRVWARARVRVIMRNPGYRYKAMFRFRIR